MLVRERQADHFEIFLFDDAPQAARGLLLLVGPERVTHDETHPIIPSITQTYGKLTAPHTVRHCERSEAIQTFIRGDILDCFASLAMTKEIYSAAVRRWTLSAMSFGTGAAHGAPRRRFTSTSIQNVSQPCVGPMPSIVAGP